MKCVIELFVDNKWVKVATYETLQESESLRGYKGKGYFAYDYEYAIDHLGAKDLHAVSCRYPVNFDVPQADAWPPFLLDVLPSGAGRRILLERYGIKQDGPETDWELLLKGGGNVPGNLRIAEAAALLEQNEHEGFLEADVLERKETFIEYAYAHGAPVAGSTGAQGDAPKFLLTQDRGSGRWHADGALPDHKTKKHWLVKFPRGKQETDRLVLKNECSYAHVAKEVGLNVKEMPHFKANILFVPRFDRIVTAQGVIRLGQESLCSLAGVSEFGPHLAQEELCRAIHQHCTNPQKDIREFVFRDVMNVALGNTDNHPRNTAISKYPDGTIELSPLYDFAPMFLDDQGIARVCRWQSDVERAGLPDWAKVAERVAMFGLDAKVLRKEMAQFGNTIERLPDIMRQAGVDDIIIERRAMRIKEVSEILKKADP